MNNNDNKKQPTKKQDGVGRGQGGPGRGLGHGPGKRSAQLRALAAQKNEITEHHIYRNLAKSTKNKQHRKILQQLGRQEQQHYNIWCDINQQKSKPNWIKVWFFTFISKIFGLSFGLRLMEKGEELARENYEDLQKEYPKVAGIVQEEQQHEEKLIGMINEKMLSYVGSVVLGLNDALVELTGALAGLTLALADTDLIAMVGFITGFAASLSMGASEYLSNKEDDQEDALQAGIITGLTYLVTVFVLISPYLFFANAFAALGIVLFVTILIIAAFTFYTSVAKQTSFLKRFARMSLISLGVAVINFVLAFGIRQYFGVDV